MDYFLIIALTISGIMGWKSLSQNTFILLFLIPQVKSSSSDKDFFTSDLFNYYDCGNLCALCLYVCIYYVAAACYFPLFVMIIRAPASYVFVYSWFISYIRLSKSMKSVGFGSACVPMCAYSFVCPSYVYGCDSCAL